MRLLVVGGGFAGLSAALIVRRQHPTVSVQVLEAEPRTGGMLGSHHRGGFTFESAALTLPVATPALLELVHALGLTADLRTAIAAAEARSILVAGVAHRWPNDLASLLQSRLLPLSARLPLVGRWLAGWGALADGREESVHAFLSRQLGAAAADLLADAAVFEVSAGDARSLSVDALLPRWRLLEQRHGTWLRGISRGAPAVAGRSLAGGMGLLVDALAQSARGQIVTGARATRLELSGSGYRVEDAAGRVWEADAVLVALPAPAAGALLAAAAPEVAQPLQAIEHAPVVVAGFGFDRQQVPALLTRGQYYLPRHTGGLVRLLQVTSSLFPDHAPEGKVAVRVLAEGISEPAPAAHLGPVPQAVADPALLRLLLADVARATGLTAEPEVAHVQMWRRGFPQYTLGHRERMAQVRRALRARWPQVELAGNYLTGVGLADVLNEVRGALRRLIGPPSI
jgi:oxygen-dependent protoporphyrinogen oxidase